MEALILVDGKTVYVQDATVQQGFHLYKLQGGQVLGLWPHEIDQAATMRANEHKQRPAELRAPIPKMIAVPPPGETEPVARAHAIPLQKRPISVSYRNAPVQEIFLSMAKMAELNLVLHPKVDGTLTLELKEVPWDKALQTLLRASSMGHELEGNLLYIAPTKVLLEQAREQRMLREARAASR